MRGAPPSPEHCSLPWPTDPKGFRLSALHAPSPRTSSPSRPPPPAHLGGDPTPEIGVVGLRVQHWGDHGQPLLYQKPQRLVVGQNVVCICKLWAGGCHGPQPWLGCSPPGITEGSLQIARDPEWLLGSSEGPLERSSLQTRRSVFGPRIQPEALAQGPGPQI